jgi:hypothetical protein
MFRRVTMAMTAAFIALVVAGALVEIEGIGVVHDAAVVDRVFDVDGRL